MFPIIKKLSDVLPFIEGNQTIRVKADEKTGMTVVCYMVQDEDTFRGEHEDWERECRGMTFYPDGRIAARTMHKFFNVNEREETMSYNIDWSKVTRIMDKRDGSMITPVLLPDGTIKCKTKKSFDTKEASLADSIIAATPGGREWLLEFLQKGYTVTFEVTSPKYPIVLQYKKDELVLLHIRENTTGGYLSGEVLECLNCPFPVVQDIKEQFMEPHMDMGCFASDRVSWHKLEEAAANTEGIEGWVIQFENGDMMKVKTKWYIDLHHSVTFTRWRDIARTVCEDKADDLKAAFATVGRSTEPVIKVERQIKSRLAQLREEVEAVVTHAKVHCPTPKDAALRYKDHPMFGSIMRLYRDQEVNWMEWYMKNELENDWGLEVVEATAE